VVEASKGVEKLMKSGEWLVSKSTMLIDRRPWIYLSEHDVILPNGAFINGYMTWEVREYALVFVVTDGGIPMVRQYKHGLKSFSLDLPGGYLNIDEDGLTCAKRELLEETGYIADKWVHLSSLVLDNNRGNSRCHLFLATDAHHVSLPSLDDTEELSIAFYTFEQLLDLVSDGQVASLPTVTAIYMVLHYLKENPAI
jgi:ADP-ribose pyrophosphatase